MVSGLGLSVRIDDNLELSAGDVELTAKVRRMLERPYEVGQEAAIQGTRLAFRDALLKVLAEFHRKRSGWRVVVVLDEFSEVFLKAWQTAQAPAPRRAPATDAAPVGPDDLRFIGTLLRDREVLKNCSVVLLGKPFMVDADRRLKSEIFASLPEVRVGPQERKDMEFLVSSLAAPVKFGAELMARLWGLTRGCPYYVQLLCDAVISGLAPSQAKALDADFDRAVAAVVGDDSKFSFELTDYDLKSSEMEDRSVEQLYSVKLLCVLDKLGQARPAEEAPWVQTEAAVGLCRKTMRMDENQSRTVLRGLEGARVIETRVGANQPEVRIGVPLLAVWARKRDLYTACVSRAG